MIKLVVLRSTSKAWYKYMKSPPLECFVYLAERKNQLKQRSCWNTNFSWMKYCEYVGTNAVQLKPKWPKICLPKPLALGLRIELSRAPLFLLKYFFILHSFQKQRQRKREGGKKEQSKFRHESVLLQFKCGRVLRLAKKKRRSYEP